MSSWVGAEKMTSAGSRCSEPGRLPAGGGGFGPFHGRQALGLDGGEVVAAADDTGHLQPAVGVDPGHHVEIEAVPPRLHAHDPDRGVAGAQHEVVAGVAGRLREVAEQVAGAEPAGHGDGPAAIAGRLERDAPNGGGVGRIRPPRVVRDQHAKLAARGPRLAEHAFRDRGDSVVGHARVVRLKTAHVPERALDLEDVPLVGDRRGDVQRAEAPFPVADEHVLEIALRRGPHHHRLPVKEAGIGVERGQRGRHVAERLGREGRRTEHPGEGENRGGGREPPPPGVRRRPGRRGERASFAG